MMCHSQTAKPRSWFPTSWNAPVPWRYLAIRMETGTVCNSMAGMERKLQLKAWNQMACVILWQFCLKCVHHVKLHGMMILINGSEDKTARIWVPRKMLWLPMFIHVTLHHSWLPGHNILAIREMMQEILRHGELGESGGFDNMCRPVGTRDYCQVQISAVLSFKWSHWTQSFIESRH